jgi:3-hydroxyacyl-CoA dehydrogenase/enoyl-CoA hydratase/3-hydroxybutyryl-CoA epimerase
MAEAKNIRLERREDGIALVTFDRSGSSANTFDRATLDELEAIVDGLTGDAACRGIVFTSAKPSIFVAGADLRELSQLTPPQMRAVAEQGQRVFGKIAALPIPTVAAIHGACLGGGFELALACDHRVCSNDGATKIGLPETQLGILPAWGGSSRLPRLVGLPTALDMILGAKQLAPRQARKRGIVDAAVPREHLLREAVGRTSRGKAEREQHRLTNNRIAAAVIRRQAGKTLARKTGGHYPSFPRALSVVSQGAVLPLRKSLELEREALLDLVQTPECRNLVQVFFLQERAKHLRAPDAPARIGEEQRVEHVAVIGAGVMGAGIAQWCAAKGIDVVLQDVAAEPLARGLGTVQELVDGLVKRRKLTPTEGRQVIDRIRPTTERVPLGRVQVVIEAAVERMDLKRKIFADLAERAGDAALLATNTSALSISEIAESVPHPERVVGIHFFNPVAQMKLVEVVRARQTSPAAADRAVRFVQQIGKLPVVVADSPGFLVNRVLTPYLVEAGRLFAEGAPLEAIDRAMKRFGMPMGPLRLIDEVGGDVAGHVARHQAEHFGDRVAAPPVLARMEEAGLLGRKSGRGFYVYGRKGRPEVNKQVAGWAPRGGSRIDRRAMQKRMILQVINEAARCLEENVVAAPEDVDFGMIMGTGFAPFRGGPLRYADSVGIARIKQELDEHAEAYGARFEPCALIRSMAAEERGFYRTPPPDPSVATAADHYEARAERS